jgi:hypothetical protein
VSETNPKLPAAYYYVKNKKGKITGIRRRIKWIRHVPALTIIKGKLRPGFLRFFDPKAAARAQLRRALSCKATEEAHHVVPLELRNHPIVELAEANNWQFNGNDNGKCLSKKVHSGSHPIYTESVRQKLDALLTQHAGKPAWPDVKDTFLKTVVGLKGSLSTRTTKLR